MIYNAPARREADRIAGFYSPPQPVFPAQRSNAVIGGTVLVRWGIALFEYALQVPGNRIGFSVMSLPQLTILQEVITLVIFIPFAVLYMQQPLKVDYLYAGLCFLGAVYFIFRS